MMRRLTKEELYRFDGTPLFPERRAYTASYELSPLEADLYQAVTTYVREEMNRADRNADGARRNNVGFALQILQRRLASSPAAIHRSLERRRKRLEDRLREERIGRDTATAKLTLSPALPAYDPDELDEAPGAETEELEEKIVDSATAAQTLMELEAEITILKDLEARALRLKLSGQDAKWRELENILDEPIMLDAASGLRRKILIFTEPKDTLEYLADKIRGRVGDAQSVVVIHGGIAREVATVASRACCGDVFMMVPCGDGCLGKDLRGGVETIARRPAGPRCRRLSRRASCGRRFAFLGWRHRRRRRPWRARCGGWLGGFRLLRFPIAALTALGHCCSPTISVPAPVRPGTESRRATWLIPYPVRLAGRSDIRRNAVDPKIQICLERRHAFERNRHARRKAQPPDWDRSACLQPRGSQLTCAHEKFSRERTL